MFVSCLQLHPLARLNGAKPAAWQKINADRRLIVADLAEAVFMQRDSCSQRIGQKGAETLLHKHTSARTHALHSFHHPPTLPPSLPPIHQLTLFALSPAALPPSRGPPPPPYLSLLIGRRSEVARSRSPPPPLPPHPHPSFQKNLRHTSESSNCIMFVFGGTTIE